MEFISMINRGETFELSGIAQKSPFILSMTPHNYSVAHYNLITSFSSLCWCGKNAEKN